MKKLANGEFFHVMISTMKKRLIIFLVGLIGVLVIGFLLNSFKLDIDNSRFSDSANQNKITNSTTATTVPELITVSQYQSILAEAGEDSDEVDVEVVTVWEYNTEIFVLGAGLDRLTLTRDQNNQASYFTDGDFTLSIGDGDISIWRAGTLHYEGYESYQSDSWMLMISDTCTSYFDGCNICTRDGACTERWCNVYKKPYCRDEALPSDLIGDNLDTPVSSEQQF